MNYLKINKWVLSVVIFSISLGFLVSVPHLLHIVDDRYQGIPVHLNSDEDLYLARVQAVLCCGSDQVGNAIAGGNTIQPLQAGIIEKAYGTFFRPFFYRASSIFTLMDFVIPMLLFLSIVWFCRASGFSRKQSFIAAALFSFLELYNLGRPIHQRVSFLLVILSMISIVVSLNKSVAWSIVAGIILGTLIGVYFWSFTAAWCFLAIATAWFLYKKDWRKLFSLSIAAGVGLVFAAPHLWDIYTLSQNSLYPEAYFRSGIGKSRTPESWAWSILFLGMSMGALANLFGTYKKYIFINLTIICSFVLLNQHLIHGTRFLFASHYLFTLVFSAVLALVLFWKEKGIFNRIAFLSSLVFLCGIAIDGRSIISQWRLDEEDFSQQHLSGVLKILDQIDQSVILSDPSTSAFLASNTKHDVLYTPYLQHELRSHIEIAERFCMTQFAIPIENRTYKDRKPLVYGAAYDGISSSSEEERVRAQEIALVDSVCEEMDESLFEFIDSYDVQYVLHDKKRYPEWDILSTDLNLNIIDRSDEWILYEVYVP
ncbi:hypothetical protein HN512_02470 [Candidatus Peregrinibacteria bacterium]|jgi:hypothetical protein|nr:hypothetical protein [Candidatus Peregrinibacteria bacterium]MBT3598677.1 hypothetical protein [Candidatus Peregrinibacteria bacterium]MBT4366984.1 hypothetical protein [Candidatus Peregrinibacteria bacterium]MBT4586041.1 hypothetical protein [Candidatus Peregrinibacteria bacterium]MBT6730453.1 hypothetical protein [Candidatus Peregrinibacteria bacterium]